MTPAVRCNVRVARAFRALAKAFRLRELSHAFSRTKIHGLMSGVGSSFWRNAKTNARNARATRSFSPPCLS